MRNAFINELVREAESNERIALIVADLGFSVVEPFADKFPERFINAGIAEQNMMGLAAGMASEGYQVFTYSIANFPTFRCAEQIRNDVDYHELSVTVVSVGGGVAYGSLGYSHHAVQDFSLIRSMPNMLIAAPGDPAETRACMKYLFKNPQPSYLRIGKAGEPCYHSTLPDLMPGKWVKIKEGEKGAGAILTTGATLDFAYKMIGKNQALQEFTLYSMPLWSMDVKRMQPNFIREHSKVITIEDHLLDGGFGSWMLESCHAQPAEMAKIRIMALTPQVCGLVGTQNWLNQAGGLSEDVLLFHVT